LDPKRKDKNAIKKHLFELNKNYEQLEEVGMSGER
jgi:hypothetical protein